MPRDASIPLLALSVRQPYAHLITAGVKRFEARTWQPRARGRIAIHASQAYAVAWRHNRAVCGALERTGLSLLEAASLPTSAIVGMVEIESVVQCDDFDSHRAIAANDRLLCVEDGWTFGVYLWRLTSPKRLKVPVSCSGRLSLWRIPSPIAVRIAQL